MADLYAPDATLTSPDATHEGRAAIAEFYRSRFRAGGVIPEVDAVYLNLPIVVAVLRVNTPSGAVHQVADVFEMSGASIRAMRACMRT